ncbi:MAG: ECF-family polymerase sigma factor [Gemmatimonadetes bacterium]|nr:ECF-family polymerase sigma factor [Gemmatimonadota bacterium]
MAGAMGAHSPTAMTPLAIPSIEATPPMTAPDAATELRVEDVYREHFGFVWRSLRHLGVGEPDVEDAVQDVFVVVHAKLASFEQRAQLTTWIYGICIHVTQARRRRAHVRRELPTDPRCLPIDASQQASADEAYERREAESLLDGILDTLAIEQRAVFTLFELEGRSCEEIAQLCAIPIGTVYSRLRLAREAFKRASARLEARERFAGGGK